MATWWVLLVVTVAPCESKSLMRGTSQVGPSYGVGPTSSIAVIRTKPSKLTSVVFSRHTTIPTTVKHNAVILASKALREVSLNR